MSYERRTTDRRRRVLYSSHHADNEPTTAASRRAAQRLREARSPSTAYGSRVHRRLRGRWFSLVPVRRVALISWCTAVGAIVGLLCLAHYASVTWPSIAYRPEIARTLRLDRPDSFGRWFTCVLLAGSAGISLLIYQLRRHKNDDFRGHYRLWRLVLVVLLMASVDALVSVVDWSGALLDASFGKRVALSGNDWIRIVLSIGGAILALRLTVEVRRSRWALSMILVAWAILAFPVAARWNFFAVDSMSRWVLVTSAPLLGSAMIFISLGGYLRMLYREVRKIDDSRSMAQRLDDLRLRVFAPREDVDEPVRHEPKRRVKKKKTATETEQTHKRGWFGRRRDRSTEPSVKKEPVDTYEPAEESESDPSEQKPRKRGWFGLRKKAIDQDRHDTDAASSETDEEPVAAKPKRRGFSMRLRPSTSASPAAEDEVTEADSPDENESSEEKPKKRFGLGGWMNRGKSSDSSDATDEHETSNSNPTEPHHQAGHQPEHYDDDIDVDEIDWSSMSKSERRRLRKKLKRQGRAA